MHDALNVILHICLCCVAIYRTYEQLLNCLKFHRVHWALKWRQLTIYIYKFIYVRIHLQNHSLSLRYKFILYSYYWWRRMKAERGNEDKSKKQVENERERENDIERQRKIYFFSSVFVLFFIRVICARDSVSIAYICLFKRQISKRITLKHL